MANLNDKFSALSMKDRAELINIYVKGGMMDLKEIKAHYNSLYEEKEPNKYGWGGASKEALGKAFGDASSTVGSVGNIAGSAMTMVSNGMENAEINTTEADNAIEAVKSYKLDNSSLDALANSYNSTPWAATDYDSSDFTKSGWEIAGNTFESTLSGITTGASVGGPWGAVIGGLAGLGSGLIGWGIGESKAEEAERRLEAQAKKANRAIELNAVNTRDSILQRQANNTLRNIDAEGGRLNKFGPGGAIENEQENSEYATTTKQDLEDVETFNSNWYKYRDKQLADAVRSYYAPQHITRGLSFWQNSFPEFVNDTKLAGGARNYINERLEALKEFTIEEAVKDNQAKQVLIDDYYSYFPNERTENEVEIGPPRIPDNQSLIRLHNLIYKGGYSKPAHLITYSNGHENTSTKIHERAHASIYQDVMGYHSVLKPIRNVVLKQGVNAHKYYDKLTEVYSRLMQLRFENNIDPTHTYTLEEVEAMRNDSNFKDFHIFDRYTDESILMLLNEVAHNNTDSNRLDYINPDNIAAFGGKL